MKSHPYADLFPLMNNTEFEALCDDMRVNGLRTPIVIYQEKILDGRNRERACRETKTPLRTSPYHGDDALGYVLSLNLHRRHLNEAERGK